MTDAVTPAELARSIAEARQRFVSFVQQCTGEDWRAAPVDGDPRPVGVIADHVAHAYEYLAGWITDLVAGRPAEVSAAIVDELNAGHASDAASVTPEHVAGHLTASGDAIIALVAGLTAAELDADEGRVARLAAIAVRHPDSHRTEIMQALGTAS